MAEAKSSLKLALFEALEKAFPDGEVTVKEYSPGSSKLAARRLIHPHIGARVLFNTAEGQYAIAGMIPAKGEQNDIDELVARLADDKRRTEIILTPGRVF